VPPASSDHTIGMPAASSERATKVPAATSERATEVPARSSDQPTQTPPPSTPPSMHEPPRWLAAPVVLFFALFLLYPALYAIKLAVTDPLTGRVPVPDNFVALGSDALFWRALAGNVVLPLASVALELIAGLTLALFLHERFPGRRALRAIVIIPLALPEVVFLTMMRSIFAPRGYANAALAAIGLGQIQWLAPGSIMTMATVVLVDAWHVTPIVFLMLLAGLASMPEQIHEAALLDGARGWSRFRHITLPWLRPVILSAVLLRGLDALRMFATPLVLAGVEGAPVLSTYAYHQWSDYGNEPAAAAASMLLAMMSVALTIPLLRRRMVA